MEASYEKQKDARYTNTFNLYSAKIYNVSRAH